jgi:hypothetical protein
MRVMTEGRGKGRVKYGVSAYSIVSHGGAFFIRADLSRIALRATAGGGALRPIAETQPFG